MTIRADLQSAKHPRYLGGFSNLFYKENCAWWRTRRWWVNLFLWAGLLGGLVGMMLFVLPPLAHATGDPTVTSMGGPIPFAMELGRMAFFEFGSMAIAVGVIILGQDLIVGEKQSGVAEWLLSKPLDRRSYMLSKLLSNVVSVMVLLIAIPSLIVYGLFFMRTGEPYPLQPFLAGVAILSLHTFFYLALTLMAGTLFNGRGPILAITLGSLLGGSILGGLAKGLLFISPWPLAKVASAIVAGLPLPAGMQIYPLLATGLWSVLFIILASWKFERTEF